MAHQLGWLEALGAGVVQGVATVFPISGPGHAVVIHGLVPGAAADLSPVRAVYLYALLRLAVGVALLAYLWRDWYRALAGVVAVAVRRSGARPDQRWGARVVTASLLGCIVLLVVRRWADPLLEHPLVASLCLTGNGALLLGLYIWWRLTRGAAGLSGTHRARITRGEDSASFSEEMSHLLPLRRALPLGVLPVAAVVPGISGIGLAITAGIVWGLTHEQAVRAALIVSTPVLLVWGVRDLPDLGAARFDPVRGPLIVGAVAALVAAYLAVMLMMRYFRKASVRPFGVYCVIAGGVATYLLAR